jgi:hypothetical protein
MDAYSVRVVMLSFEFRAKNISRSKTTGTPAASTKEVGNESGVVGEQEGDEESGDDDEMREEREWEHGKVFRMAHRGGGRDKERCDEAPATRASRRR